MQHCKACLSACGISDAVEDSASNAKDLLEHLPSSTTKNATFSFSPMFQTAAESDRAPIRFTPPAWKKIDGDFADVLEIPLPGGKSKKILSIKKGALATLAHQCVIDVQHFFRHDQLSAWANILSDPEASDNDRFVATQLLKNACISAGQVLPSCQDTGTAIVMGKKGEQVWTDEEHGDEEGISHGIWLAYQNHYLRYSQTAALDMFNEVNTKNNLPAQIDLLATKGCEYNFLVVAKGGGSANKSYLYQQTKALLNPKSLRAFIREKLKTLGTSACPPYTIALVIGGTSAEMTMKTVKLASCRYYDNLPTTGDATGRAFRDVEWEKIVLEEARSSNIGAQFGGKYFAHQVRVIRLPRHGASCPVGLGVSCSADRQILAKITPEGMFLEQLEYDPAKYLPESIAHPPVDATAATTNQVVIDLNMGMDALRKTLSKYPIRTRLLLNGDLIVARDIAHAKIQERLDSGLGLPDYVKNSVIYYAGPAKTPSGEASGSFGPTTAGRMDSYVPTFMEAGGSFVTLAKGNRSKGVTDACQKNGGFYLGSIGGAAAILARENITKVEVVEFPELGMEAVWRISVKDFPAFIIVDDKDPTEFFYGMRLTFDGPPHLVQLKQAIEARAVQDNALPDGSRYIITDLEILDLRLNMWTPLDSRTQLYSGCHVCAIRDNGSATSSGPIDVARKLPQQRALGFALDVESTFRALDVENRGLVSLSNVLHVFRHDLNYAVDFFQLIDVRNCGQVTMQDLMSATAKKNSDFWKELQLRISRGGLDPGITSNRAALTYMNGNQNDNGAVAYRGGGGGFGSNSSSPPGTPRSGAPSPMSKLGLGNNRPGSGASNNNATPTRRQGIAAAIIASARQQKEDETKKETASVTSNNNNNNNSFGSGDGSPAASPGNNNNSDSKAVASAKKVLALFQQASRPKTMTGASTIGGGGGASGGDGKGVSGAMAKMKELANKASTKTNNNNNNSAASVTGSNSTMNSPSASKRK